MYENTEEGAQRLILPENIMIIFTEDTEENLYRKSLYHENLYRKSLQYRSSFELSFEGIG